MRYRLVIFLVFSCMIGSCMLPAAAEELNSRQRAWIKEIVQNLPKNADLQTLVQNIINNDDPYAPRKMDFRCVTLVNWVNNNKVKTYWNAVAVAAQTWNNDILPLLLENRDVNELDSEGRSDLIKVVLVGNAKATEMLFKAKAKAKANVNVDANQLDPEGLSPLMIAVKSSEDRRIIGMLLDAKADPNALFGNDDTILTLALKSENRTPDTVKMLINAGADVNARNRAGVIAVDAVKIDKFPVNRYSPSDFIALIVAARKERAVDVDLVEAEKGAATSPSSQSAPARESQPQSQSLAQPVTAGPLAIPHSSFGSFLPSFGVIASLGVATLLAAALYAWHYYPSNTVKE